MLSAIARNPGIHKSELRRLLGLGWGTVAYHIHALQGKGRIKVLSQGREVRLFPTGVSPQQMAWLCASRNPVHASILDRLAQKPGVRASELGATLGISANNVRRHLGAMGESGIVGWKGTHGRRYYLTDPQATPVAAPPALPRAHVTESASPSRHYNGDGSRERILAAVQASPGIHTSDLTRATGVTWGNMAHHLRVLESEGQVAKSVHGSRTCYFTPDVPEEDRALLVARRNEVSSLILDALGQQGSLMPRDIVRHTGARTSTVARYLKHLVEEDIVRPADPIGNRFELVRTEGMDEPFQFAGPPTL